MREMMRSFTSGMPLKLAMFGFICSASCMAALDSERVENRLRQLMGLPRAMGRRRLPDILAMRQEIVDKCTAEGKPVPKFPDHDSSDEATAVKDVLQAVKGVHSDQDILNVVQAIQSYAGTAPQKTDIEGTLETPVPVAEKADPSDSETAPQKTDIGAGNITQPMKEEPEPLPELIKHNEGPLRDHYSDELFDKLIMTRDGRERVLSYVNNNLEYQDRIEELTLFANKEKNEAVKTALNKYIRDQDSNEQNAIENAEKNAKKIGGDLLITGFTFGALTASFYALAPVIFRESMTSDVMWSIVTGVGIFSLVFLWYGTKMCYQGKIGDVNTTFAVIVTLLGGGALVLNTGVIEEVTVNLSAIPFYIAIGAATIGGTMLLVQIIKKCKKC